MRMTERIPDDEILRYEIIRKKKKKPEYYLHLANSLDYKQIKELTYKVYRGLREAGKN